MAVANRIRAYIQKELLVDTAGQRIDDDTPLLNGLLDSTDLMHLLTFLEESFGVALELSELSVERFGTIRDIERFVVTKLPQT